MNSGRIHEGVKESDLQDFFRGYGTIVGVKHYGKYASIEFDDARDCSLALNCRKRFPATQKAIQSIISDFI